MTRHEEPTDPTTEELVPENDEIIGRAFRWSALGILLVAGVLAGVLLFSGGGEGAEIVREKSAGEITNLTVDLTLPELPFTDVTAKAGITFVHETGARGQKLLPETMGSGVAFLDYDGDGDQDLFFVNSTFWPDDPRAESPPRMALFANDGKGNFTDVTDDAGLGEISVYGMGVAVGDFDGDGYPDLYITALGPNLLLRNDGGRFVDVTSKSGTAGQENGWSTSAGFFDYDGDGDLDLFVLDYVQWSKEIDMELAFTLNGRDRAYGPPANYQGTFPLLFENLGDGTFAEVSERAGLRVVNRATGVPVGKSLGLLFHDFDRDGDLDVFVANDTVRNFLFENRGDGTFREVAEARGFAYDGMGHATGAMGIDATILRDDGSLAIGIGNFANEMTSLYVAPPGDVLFTDNAIVEGIGSPSRLRLTFGLVFLDVDLDGRPDMLQTNGHLETEIQSIQESQTYPQPAQLFWNAGEEARSTFVVMPEDGASAALHRPIVGRGVAYADIDGDGDLDLVLTQSGGPPLLLRNDQALEHHWLRVKLVGAAPNTCAIGATVELHAAGRVQHRLVSPTRSYLSQVELPVTFGLGKTTAVERVVITWPSGTKTTVEGPQIDQMLTVREE